jgi:hypothetical protein
MFNQWLRSECERFKVATLSARPWNTVLGRAAKILA